jgi:hypothetical protein
MRRERPVAALIGADDLERLERVGEIARRLAHSLGQSAELLDGISAGMIHPVMAAFGLWSGEEDLADLDKTIVKNRQNPSRRENVDL